MCCKLKELFLNIIFYVKKFFHNVITTSKELFCKTCNFFGNKKFLLIVILCNVLFLCSMIHLFREKNKIPIPLVVCVPLTSCLLLVGWYANKLVYWSNDESNIIKKSFSFLMEMLVFLSPIFGFLGSYSLAKFYFEENIAKYQIVVCVLFLIIQLIYIVFYCCELIDIIEPKYDNKYRVITFSYIIIHIIQLFTNIYLLLLAFNPNSIQTIDAETPSQLCFDIIYFSAMTFVGGDSVLSPNTRLVQAVVLVESLIFTIYISIIIFNLISTEKGKKDIQ